MSRTPPYGRIERAAVLRASGLTWADTADRMRLCCRTIERMRSVWPDEWQRALRRAEARIVEEAYAEALSTMRARLHSRDERVSQAAAHSLLHHTLAVRAQIAALAAAASDEADGITEEEAHAIVTQLLADATDDTDVVILGADPSASGGDHEQPGGVSRGGESLVSAPAPADAGAGA